MKFRYIIIFLAIAGIGTGITLRYSAGKSKSTASNTPTVTVKQGEFVIAISDTGVIKANKSKTVYIPEGQRSWGGVKISKLVPEGTHVKKGDPICWLDLTELEKQLKESEFQVKNNERQLQNYLESLRLQRENRARAMKEKKLDWDSAKLELEIETKKYDKVKRLVNEEILPQQDYEDEERKFRAATLKIDQAEKEYLKAAEQQTSDEKMKEIDIERTKNRSNWYKIQYDQLTESIAQSTLYAPEEGMMVYQKNWRGRNMQTIKEGDTLWPGNPVAMIPDLREIQVMSQVAETDVSKITEGMPVRVKMDSIPDLNMTGEISQIGSLAVERERSAGSGQVSTEEASGIKVFEITIDINGTDERLRPGMTCKVDMILETAPSKIYIPLNAIRMDQNSKYVIIKKDGKEERKTVTLGKQNNKEVVVEQGLKPGEEVYLPEEES